MTDLNIDLWDHDAFQRQEHHELLARLRETDPGIHWIDEGDAGPGYWAITRLAHLKEVNRQADIFSSNAAGTQMTEPDFSHPMTQAMNDGLMIELDAPKHTRFRRIVSRGFTPRMIQLLEDYLQNRTDSIIDRVSERGDAEFVEELSAELPLQAIAEMVGIPIEDRSKIFDWTNRMIGGNDPDFAADPDDATSAATELFMYSRALQTERRDQPADDIITTLLSVDLDGERLTEDEFDMFFLLLSVAGNETTRNSITRGMMAFFDFPDQWDMYVSDPARYEDTMVDEVVRWASPVMHFRRQCTRDYELNGVQMKAGDKVVMWHVAANRDPRAFEDPWSFDIERTPNDHVGFGGGGPHFCLGANLARMEIKLMFREIATRLPDIGLDGEISYLRSNFIGGVKKLPVTFTPSPSLGTVSLERLGSAAGASGTEGFGGDVERTE
ncbi:MAG: cytochrome P450 [Acidimicrobiales bacterium]|nr:cytochrome P450 [Acidimicrobiales bacterium]MDG1877175.1 cytochrome P450 [Acidimicrobiales bacterium]